MEIKTHFSRQPFLQQTHVSLSKSAVFVLVLMAFRVEPQFFSKRETDKKLLDDGIQLERDAHPQVFNKIGVRVILGSEPFCVSYRQSEF